jgi:hypothetical protein
MPPEPYVPHLTLAKYTSNPYTWNTFCKFFPCWIFADVHFYTGTERTNPFCSIRPLAPICNINMSIKMWIVACCLILSLINVICPRHWGFLPKIRCKTFKKNVPHICFRSPYRIWLVAPGLLLNNFPRVLRCYISWKFAPIGKTEIPSPPPFLFAKLLHNVLQNVAKGSKLSTIFCMICISIV